MKRCDKYIIQPQQAEAPAGSFNESDIMNNTRETAKTASCLINIIIFISLMTGMHNIDNAWNIENFAKHNNIQDCTVGFMCKDSEGLYQIGVGVLMFSLILMILNYAILILYL